MILPEYNVKIIEKTKSQLLLNIEFDKVVVVLRGDAKYDGLYMKYTIKKGYHRRNVNLLKYLKAINDYLTSNNYIATYNDRQSNILDSNKVKRMEINQLKITSGEIEYIDEKYPNLISFETNKCTIYEQANFGILDCENYRDYKSDIISLDSYNGFSGRRMYFQNSNILKNNKNILHLYNTILTMYKIDIDYETFILMLDAPNLRKLEIFNTKKLKDKDLLFISGLYNLEMLEVDAVLSNADQIKKLERLRDTSRIYISGDSELEKVKNERKNYYDLLKSSGKSEKELKEYLMYQYMITYKKYLNLLDKLYIRRLDRISWESKIKTDDLNKVRDELLTISNMSYKDRKNIAREIKEYNLKDSLDDLWFDKIPEQEEDLHITNSSPFTDSGIDYYVKKKKIILD